LEFCAYSVKGSKTYICSKWKSCLFIKHYLINY